MWQGRMSKDDEALVRTTLSLKGEARARMLVTADDTEAKGIRLIAVHYPARPGNGLRSVRPVRIGVLSVAQLVNAGALHRRMGTSGQIH